MTTELEQEFFKVFGVAMQHLLNVNTNQFVDVYPEITDRVLLKLIIIAMNYGNRYRWINDTSNVEELKSETLELLIKLAELLPHIKHQIQQLFKEEE